MALNFEVGGTTFKEASESVAGGASVVGSYWYNHVIATERQFDRRRVTRPGQKGFHIKDFGSRGKTIQGDVFYVNGTYAGVIGAMNGDRSALENVLFDVSTPAGVAYGDCELVGFSDGLIYPLFDGKLFMKTTIIVFQISE
jgi:hypothetical protein